MAPSSSVRALLQRSIEPRFDRPENQRRLYPGNVAKEYGNRVMRSGRIARLR
jgi:hypothetical protein